MLEMGIVCIIAVAALILYIKCRKTHRSLACGM